MPSGSTVGSASGTSRPGLRLRQIALYTALRRELLERIERLVLAGVAWDERQREVVAARLDDGEQVVDARRDRALLPARDHRALAPGALGELGLREPRAKPRLSN